MFVEVRGPAVSSGQQADEGVPMKRGPLSTIIGILVVIILVIVILQLI